MPPETDSEPNVQQAVPFFMVSNIEASMRFYIDGLGFRRTNQWIVDGKIRWCWLEIGRAALMLQEYRPDSPLTTARLGEGVSLCFQCRDALAIYHEALSRGLQPQRPFVGNNMWVTILTDPDGYKLDFESPTTVPEETVYTDNMELSTTYPKINPKTVAYFSSPKYARQHATIRHASTTISPSKNHAQHPVFLKTHSKNTLPPRRKN